MYTSGFASTTFSAESCGQVVSASAAMFFTWMLLNEPSRREPGPALYRLPRSTNALFSSVTVVTKDSGLADALSTALFGMPLADGEALCESLGNVEALWVLSDGEMHVTPGMEALLVSDEPAGDS